MLKQMSDTIQNATVVGEINEMEDNLCGAELGDIQQRNLAADFDLHSMF